MGLCPKLVSGRHLSPALLPLVGTTQQCLKGLLASHILNSHVVGCSRHHHVSNIAAILVLSRNLKQLQLNTASPALSSLCKTLVRVLSRVLYGRCDSTAAVATRPQRHQPVFPLRFTHVLTTSTSCNAQLFSDGHMLPCVD